jgi:hypothetical protein
MDISPPRCSTHAINRTDLGTSVARMSTNTIKRKAAMVMKVLRTSARASCTET